MSSLDSRSAHTNPEGSQPGAGKTGPGHERHLQAQVTDALSGTPESFRADLAEGSLSDSYTVPKVKKREAPERKKFLDKLRGLSLRQQLGYSAALLAATAAAAATVVGVSLLDDKSPDEATPDTNNSAEPSPHATEKPVKEILPQTPSALEEYDDMQAEDFSAEGINRGPYASWLISVVAEHPENFAYGAESNPLVTASAENTGQEISDQLSYVSQAAFLQSDIVAVGDNVFDAVLDRNNFKAVLGWGYYKDNANLNNPVLPNRYLNDLAYGDSLSAPSRMDYRYNVLSETELQPGIDHEGEAVQYKDIVRERINDEDPSADPETHQIRVVLVKYSQSDKAGNISEGVVWQVADSSKPGEPLNFQINS